MSPITLSALPKTTPLVRICIDGQDDAWMTCFEQDEFTHWKPSKIPFDFLGFKKQPNILQLSTAG